MALGLPRGTWLLFMTGPRLFLLWHYTCSYLFGAISMATATLIRYLINRDTSVFIIKTATFGGLAYAVLVSSALCYGLITYCNKHVSSLVVTASWPLQVSLRVPSWLLVPSHRLPRCL